MSKTIPRLPMLTLALIALGGAAFARAAPQTQPIDPRDEQTRPAPSTRDPEQRPDPTPPVPPPAPPAPTGADPPTGTDPTMPGARTEPSPGTAAEPHQPSPGTAADVPRPEDEASALPPKDQEIARRVLTELQQASATEVELAQLALERGTSEELKSYASMLIDDHRNAAERVNAFAQGHGIVLPGAAAGAAGVTTGAPGANTAGDMPPTGTGTGSPGADMPGTEPGATGVTTEAADIEGLPEIPASTQRIIERLGRLEGQRFDRQMVNAMINSHNKTLNKLRQANRRAKNQELKSLLTEMSTTIESHLQRARELKRSGLAQANEP